MKNFTFSAKEDLSNILTPSQIKTYSERQLNEADRNSNFRLKNESHLAQTPSTASSMFKRSGCAISKSRKNNLLTSSKPKRSIRMP